MIRDKYQRVDPVVQGSFLDLGDPRRRNFNKEFKKSLGGKPLLKNFSRSNVVLVTTIPAQIPKPEWLIIHFCSPSKNEIIWRDPMGRRFTRGKGFRERGESVSLFEAEWSDGRSCFCEVKRSKTRPTGSVTERKNRLTLSWQKGWCFQFVGFSCKWKTPF